MDFLGIDVVADSVCNDIIVLGLSNVDTVVEIDVLDNFLEGEEVLRFRIMLNDILNTGFDMVVVQIISNKSQFKFLHCNSDVIDLFL